MPEAFGALLLAHALADFVLQTRWMAEHKRHPRVLALHGFAIWATAALAAGSLSPWLMALALAHLFIDIAKSFAPRGLAGFLVDQAVHLATLMAAAAMIGPVWPQYPPAAALMTLAAGLILVTRAGGFAVSLLMARWDAPVGQSGAGLTDGGRWIGLLERLMIYLLVLTGQAQAIGYLIAAKSVLQFGTVGDDRRMSEYVIIGTLASMTWAIAVSVGILVLMPQLPPLGIPRPAP